MNVALFSLPIAVLVLRIIFIALLAIFLAVLTLAMRRNLAGTIAASPDADIGALSPQALALVVIEPGRVRVRRLTR